jgi:uncharacterized damage-inducible protein DinB
MPRGSRRASSHRPLTAAPIVEPGLGAGIIDMWRTNCRVTDFLIEQLPASLLDAALPGIPRRTIRIIAAHLHNSRARWIRTLGVEHGVRVPALVNLRRVSQRQLLAALRKSGDGIEKILQLGLAAGGSVPPSRVYVWRNLPLEVPHVLGYFVAHEGHHRGQIVMLARQLGQPLPRTAVDGLWQWTTRVREVRASRRGASA